MIDLAGDGNNLWPGDCRRQRQTRSRWMPITRTAHRGGDGRRRARDAVEFVQRSQEGGRGGGAEQRRDSGARESPRRTPETIYCCCCWFSN